MVFHETGENGPLQGSGGSSVAPYGLRPPVQKATVTSACLLAHVVLPSTPALLSSLAFCVHSIPASLSILFILRLVFPHPKAWVVYHCLLYHPLGALAASSGPESSENPSAWRVPAHLLISFYPFQRLLVCLESHACSGTCLKT